MNVKNMKILALYFWVFFSKQYNVDALLIGIDHFHGSIEPQLIYRDCNTAFINSLETAIIQLTCYLNFGDTFEDDPSVASTIKTYSTMDKEVLITNDVIAFAPWVRHLYHTKNYKKLLKSLDIRKAFITRLYEDRKQNLNSNNLKSVVDNIILLCQDKEFVEESGKI